MGNRAHLKRQTELRELEMSALVTVHAERNQVCLIVVAGSTSKLNVMDLKSLSGPASLTSSTIQTKDELMQLKIGFGLQF